MFSFEDYYKLLNSASEASYQEKREKLESYLSHLKNELPKSKGFREKKEKYLLFVGSFLNDVCLLEARRREAFRLNATTTELAHLQNGILEYFKGEAYQQNFFCPRYANDMFFDGLGLYLCALAAVFVPSVFDAFASRRYMLLKSLDFYFAIVKNFEEQRITPESIQKLVEEHKIASLEDELSLEFLSRTALDRSAYATLSPALNTQMDWSNLNFLYRAPMPIDSFVEEVASKLADADQSFIEEKATAVVDAIKRFSNQDKNNKRSNKNKKDSYDKLSLFCFSLGTERVVTRVLDKVKELDLSVEYLPIVTSTYALPGCFEKDHASDATLWLTNAYRDAYRAVWGKLEIRFASLLGQLHSDFFLRINTPYVEPVEHAPVEGALTLSEEQEAILKDLNDMKRVSLGQTLPCHYFNELTYTLVLN